MKIAACSDVHLGNHRRFGGDVQASMNDRCRRGLAVFEHAVQRAIDANCGMFIVAGDTFDCDTPEPALVRGVQRVCEHAQSEDMEMVFLLGNHDQTSATHWDNALAPLCPVATVVEVPTRIRRGGVEVVLVPFQVGPAKDWLPGALQACLLAPPDGERVPRLLAVHLGIRDAKTAPWLAAANDAVDVELLQELCLQHGIEFVVAGNWHDRREWHGAAHVLQLGALVPTGWDNPGLTGYGTVAFLGEGALTFEELPGPRFLKATTTQALQDALDDNDALGNALYVSATALPEELVAETAVLEAMRARGLVVAAEVLPDEQVSVAQLREAATAAGQAETLEAALESFVKKMPMPDGVQRDEVFERARGYLP